MRARIVIPMRARIVIDVANTGRPEKAVSPAALSQRAQPLRSSPAGMHRLLAKPVLLYVALGGLPSFNCRASGQRRF